MSLMNEILETRRDELLEELLENAEYIKLRDISADSSMAVKRAVVGTAADEFDDERPAGAVAQLVGGREGERQNALAGRLGQ